MSTFVWKTSWLADKVNYFKYVLGNPWFFSMSTYWYRHHTCGHGPVMIKFSKLHDLHMPLLWLWTSDHCIECIEVKPLLGMPTNMLHVDCGFVHCIHTWAQGMIKWLNHTHKWHNSVALNRTPSAWAPRSQADVLGPTHKTYSELWLWCALRGWKSHGGVCDLDDCDWVI